MHVLPVKYIPLCIFNPISILNREMIAISKNTFEKFKSCETTAPAISESVRVHDTFTKGRVTEAAMRGVLLSGSNAKSAKINCVKTLPKLSRNANFYRFRLQFRLRILQNLRAIFIIIHTVINL